MNRFIEKILQEGIEKIKILPKQFIEALGSWVLWYDGYPSNAIKTILKYNSLLGPGVKKSSEYIYRVVKWEIGSSGFGEDIRSWTETLTYAKDFATNGSIESYDKNIPVVILRIKSDQNRVIVSFSQLARNKLFLYSFNYWDEKNELMIDAAFEPKYMSTEKEIIYKQPIITEKNIYLVHDKKFGWVKWDRYLRLLKFYKEQEKLEKTQNTQVNAF